MPINTKKKKEIHPHNINLPQSNISGAMMMRKKGLIVTQSGTRNSSSGGSIVDPTLWRPGQACPVVACRKIAKCIGDSTKFKTHWLEKHEKMVAVYRCSLCNMHSKRKRDLDLHLRKKHCYEYTDFSTIVSCTLCPNKNFVDPSPLSKKMVFGNIAIDS